MTHKAIIYMATAVILYICTVETDKNKVYMSLEYVFELSRF